MSSYIQLVLKGRHISEVGFNPPLHETLDNGISRKAAKKQSRKVGLRTLETSLLYKVLKM